MSLRRVHKAPRSRVIESAGALVWRERKGRLQVLLVHRPRYDDWSWPKGKVDPGETQAVTAVREVMEETGVHVVLGTPLPGLQYLVPDGRVKRVHYWAATPAKHRHEAALAARFPVAPVDPAEIDESRWLDVDDAAEALTRQADRQPLVALVREHEHERLVTRPLVVVRHGTAMQRAYWAGTELTRPLLPAGWAQAAALVPILAAYGVVDLVTSEWTRCAQTVALYARAAGLEPHQHDRLTEADHKRSPALVAAIVRDLLDSPIPAALCTHRPVLPTVLDVLAEHSRRPVADALPQHDPFLEPGDAVVAHVATTAKGPRVVAAETVRPVV
nr:NUDIX hydrolase [Luteimicrobium subarcticum]